MKKTALLITTAAIALAISIPAFAQFADVPTDHWAYQSIQTLAEAGIIQGYPDGTFGGKRAMTRYEFAEALAKAIPQIEKLVGGAGAEGQVGPQGAPGATGPQGPAGPSGINTPEFKALQNAVAEFRNELAQQGVDIARLNNLVANLGQRVALVEAEQARVRVTGEANFIWRGEVTNSGEVIDRDGRVLKAGDDIITNSFGYNDYRVNIAGKVSDKIALKGIIAAGDYLSFALNPGTFDRGGVDQFVLWNAYADAGLNLGSLGGAQLTVGRFPFQLTPLTFKLVEPDSYNYVDILSNGDYVVDGAKATMSFGSIALTPFVFKPTIGNSTFVQLPLETPALETTAVNNYNAVGGARAAIGTPLNGILGLTYYRVGFNNGANGTFSSNNGQANVFGGDINLNVASIGVSGEYARIQPVKNSPVLDTLNNAWNGKLNFQAGKLGIGAGYTQVEANYVAPGYWARLGNIVNPQNVKGVVADLNYAFAPGLSFSAAGQFLQPANKALAVTARTATSPQQNLSTSSLDKLTYWRAGLKYSLTAANSVDLGYEELQIKPTGTSPVTTKDRFITLGVGHQFNANAGLKLLYQIIDTKDNTALTSRGGVAAAQFNLKY